MEQNVQKHSDSGEKRKQLRRRQLIITVVIALVVMIVIAIAQILSNLGLLPGLWATISSSITGVLGVVFAFVALLPILFPSDSPAQPIHIHIPQHPAQQESGHTIVETHPGFPTIPVMLSSSTTPREFRKIVGALPAISPITIQQREETVKQIYAYLTLPDISAVVLTGIGGIGKSTLAALVYSFVENQRQQKSGFFKESSIWLTIDAGVTMADLVGTVFEMLSMPIPDLDHLTPSNQALVLFDVLKKADQPRLLVLDQFENFLNWQTGHALEGRFGVDEWLDVLNSQQLGATGCRVLLTSRVLPRGAHEYPFTCLREYPVSGLQESEGVELLRKLTGSIKATDADLRMAVERCGGHAYALTLLASLLRLHNLSLIELFNNPLFMELWEGDLASKMLDYIYQQQLALAHRDLLLAFSVYRHAVPPGAAQAVIGSERKFSAKELSKAFKDLLNLHLLQVSGEGHYQLHAIVIGYAHRRFDEDDEQQNRKRLQAAYERAAYYYQTTPYPPVGERKSVEDVQPLIEAAWELCKAEQWQKAYALMVEEKLIDDLDRLGAALILLELFQNLLPLHRWQPTSGEQADIYKHIGLVYYRLGKLELALDYYRRALSIYQTDKNLDGQGDILFRFGEVYHGIGPVEKSLASYEEALTCYQQANNRKGIAVTLTNLCWVHGYMGQLKKALDFGQQALSLCLEMNDRWGESSCYDALAQIYNYMEQRDQEQHYLELTLKLYRELGNHWQEGWMDVKLGMLLRAAGDITQAQQLYEEALTISRRVKNPWLESAALMELGKIFFAQGQFVQADEYNRQALAVSRAAKDRWGECKVLNALGQFQNHLEQRTEALELFKQALVICREIGNTIEESTGLCGIAEIYLVREEYSIALASLHLAKNIYLKSQGQCPSHIQELLDHLHTILGDEQFATLMAQVEPQAAQLVAQVIESSGELS